MKLYVISLASHEERRASAIAEANKSAIEYEVIDAIDGEWMDKDALKAITKPGAPNRYGMACVLSHVKALRRFLESGEKYCMIVEDDWILNQSIADIGSLLPDDAAYITLSRIRHECAPVEIINHNEGSPFERLDSVPISTVGYIISRQFAEYVVDAIIPVNAHIDGLYRSLMIYFCGKVYRAKKAYVSGKMELPSILHHDNPTA